MSTLLQRSSPTLLVLGALGLALTVHSATAQSATGIVTGRVLWGSCVRAIPLPMSPEGQVQPAAPEAIPDFQPGPGVRPFPVPGPINGLPAGAVLVAVQNTGVSARTDEAGRFTLSGVPASQYMTVAAGPVANSLSATASRPNVFVTGGQNIDFGTLSLGGAAPVGGIVCRFPSGATDTIEAEPAP
jgi:hypothetical protein